MELSDLINQLMHEFPASNSDKSDSSDVNILKLLHMDDRDNGAKKIYENTHTRILASLLEWKDAYGRQLFLERFLKRTSLSIPKILGTNITVSTQHKAYGVNNGKGYIDCAILSDDYAVIIENKINNASDMQNQIARYILSLLSENDCKNLKAYYGVNGDLGRREWDDKVYGQNSIFVLYLTADDSKDMPSGELPHFAEMTDENNCHLEAISYQYHVLPWLEEDVLPNIPFGCRHLLMSVMLYVDYLKSFLQINNNVGHTTRNKIQKYLEKSNIGIFTYEIYKELLSRKFSSEKGEKIVVGELIDYCKDFIFGTTIDNDWQIHYTASCVQMWKRSWIESGLLKPRQLYFQTSLMTLLDSKANKCSWSVYINDVFDGFAKDLLTSIKKDAVKDKNGQTLYKAFSTSFGTHNLQSRNVVSDRLKSVLTDECFADKIRQIDGFVKQYI